MSEKEIRKCYLSIMKRLNDINEDMGNLINEINGAIGEVENWHKYDKKPLCCSSTYCWLKDMRFTLQKAKETKLADIIALDNGLVDRVNENDGKII